MWFFSLARHPLQIYNIDKSATKQSFSGMINNGKGDSCHDHDGISKPKNKHLKQ